MLPKPLFKQLVKHIQDDVAQQTRPRNLGGEGQAFVAVTKGFYTLLTFTLNHERVRIAERDLTKAWPAVMKAVGLVDDGTNTNTWTLPGKSILEVIS